MPVINNTGSYVEIFIKGKSLAKSKKFSLQKPLLYVHGLKIKLSGSLLKLEDISLQVTTSDQFTMVGSAEVVSYISFMNQGKGEINDITFACDGTYLTFELPKFKSLVRDIKRGKGVILP